jgi:predicted GTPase|tara:strand:- start:105 stop:554 length:450 start_codon:yes stop_codon:yes gene_type:complete
MSEEVTNTDSSVEEDKNWKAVREENKALKEELVKYQTQERDTLFQQVGLDRTKGVGKAADMMYEGDLEVDALKAFLTEEFGESVVSGQQDSIRNTVNEGQNRLDALQQQAQTINAAPNVQEQIAQAQQSGRVRDSIASKMMALDELKDK